MPRLIHEKKGILWLLSLLKVLSDHIKDTLDHICSPCWICAEHFFPFFFIVVVWLRECFSDSFGLLVGLIIDLQFILAAFVQQSPRVSSLAEHRTDCQAEGGGAAWMKITPRLVIGGEGQREETSMLGKKPNASRTHKPHYTHLQCLWTPATVSMMEHSPSFRQKARSLSSTHGLKTSERRLGSVGATARDRRRQRDRFSYY